jgi:hypothetical protein
MGVCGPQRCAGDGHGSAEATTHETDERRVGGARGGAGISAEGYARVARTLSKQLEQ